MSKQDDALTPAVKARLEKLLQSTGWVPDPPSPDDFTAGHPAISKLLQRTGIVAKRLRRRLPTRIDLRPWCSPVLYQGRYNTCTAHVVTSMVALHDNRAHGRHVMGSRLFLYQVTKRILGDSGGDPGVYLRQMMGCLVLIGVPPESYFPYLDTSIDDDPRITAEPDAFCYAVANDARALRYIRLDPLGDDPAAVCQRIRTFLAAGLGSSIGFPLYMSSLQLSVKSGEIPMPPSDERPAGSHAVLLVGYDDEKAITAGGVTTTGAFLFKNSWGADWGDAGYGWLPYEYLLSGQSHDVWTLLQASWVDTAQFQIGWDQPSTAAAAAPGPQPTKPQPKPKKPKKPKPPAPQPPKARRAARTRSRSTSPSPHAPTNES